MKGGCMRHLGILPRPPWMFEHEYASFWRRAWLILWFATRRPWFGQHKFRSFYDRLRFLFYAGWSRRGFTGTCSVVEKATK